MKVKYGMHSVEGKGSRFWMRFTQYIGEDKAPETAAAYDNTATPIRARACLVVDDDPLVTSAWESLMSTWGITVRCAASAEEAFAIVNDGFTPFAVLCDQRLRSGERFRHPQSAVRTPAGRERRHGQRRVQLADIARGRAGRLSGAAQTAGAGQAACAADAVGAS